MKTTRIWIKGVIVIIILFSVIHIKAQNKKLQAVKNVGNLNIKIIPKTKTIIILLRNNDTIITKSCNNSGMCNIFIANTYKVRYSGIDGLIAPNETLYSLNSGIKDTMPVFSLPHYRNKIIGIVVGSAGASGGGSQSLYLIDIINGKKIIIHTSDQLNPKWFMMFGLLGYIEKSYSCFSIIDNIKLNNIYVIDADKFQVVSLYKSRVFWLLTIVSLILFASLLIIMLRKRK